MKAIVAVDDTGVMGNNGHLPWHNPEDLKLFSLLTLGHPVLMGRKTWESLDGPLKHRENLVVSETLKSAPGATILDIGDVYERMEQDNDKMFLIGGLQTYNLFWGDIDIFYVSHISGLFQGDTIFPLAKLHQDFTTVKRIQLASLSVSVLTRNSQ